MSNKEMYKVVIGRSEFSDEISRFEQKCSELIAKGYVPCGGISLNNSSTLYQAFRRPLSIDGGR
jgi:hypothetical protein